MTNNPPKIESVSKVPENKADEQDLQLKFRSLIPQEIEDNSADVYLNALSHAVQSKNVKNIALTGSYGSGKSSILMTFEKKFPEYKYLKVSLASFNKRNFESKETSKGKQESEPEEKLERLLELSILQQIFYHVDHNAIPDSRFKRIKSLNNFDLVVFALSGIIWLTSVWYLFFPQAGDILILRKITQEAMTIFMAVIFLFGLGMLLMHLRRVYNNSKLNKLNIQSGEFEIDKELDQSILNKHLDELIYFFEVNDFNVLMIEDLDRFENTEIFSKLRELNLLLNNSKQISRVIRFVYAIRDDMFTDDSRTKFFDFVIPIIPVVDPANASDILQENFKHIGYGAPSTDFLRDIASFILDMRFLNNVYNEYLIYKANLSPTIVQNNLFALILYKNFYPEDFVDLQKGKGKLHSVLHCRKFLIEELEKDLSEKIENIKKDISLLEGELIKDGDELRAIYISAIQKEQPRSVGIVINQSPYEFQDFYHAEKFEKLLTQDPLKYRVLSHPITSHSSNISTKYGKSFTSIEHKVNSQLTYYKRLDIIQEQSPLENLKSEYKTLIQEKRGIRTWELKKMLKASENILEKDFPENLLVRYLLINGYIDENYSSYISKFYPGDLSFSDNEFYQSILAGVKKGYNYPIQNKINVARKIAPRFFQTSLILNIDLINCLLHNKKEFSHKLDHILEQFVGEQAEALEFLEHYITEGFDPSGFLNLVYLKWSGFWQSILSVDDVEEEQIEEYAILLLKGVDTKILAKDAEFLEYIAFKDNFLSMVRGLAPIKVKTFIQKADLKLKVLEMPNKNDLQTFKLIIEQRKYVINKNNLITILQALAQKKKNYKTLDNNLYSTIVNSNLPALQNYVEDEIDIFTEDCLLQTSNIVEDQNELVKLISNEQIQKESREKLIIQLGVKIENLDLIEDIYFQGLLLINSKVQPTWENVISHYKINNRKISEALVTFLNTEENFHELGRIEPPSSEFILGLSSELIQENSLDLESYVIIIDTLFKDPYSNENLDSLSEEKIHWLIDNKKLALTPSNILCLKNNYPGAEIKLIKVNQNDFVGKTENFELPDKDILKLLNSSNINSSVKIELISKNPKILGEIDDKLGAEILQLLNKNSPINLGSENIKEILERSLDFHESLKLLIKYNEILSNDELRQLISLFPEKIPRVLEKGRWVQLVSDPTTLSFASLLQKRQIATYSIKDGKVRVTGKGPGG